MRLDEVFKQINEVHYTDFYPQSFEDFRKKYAALVKKGGMGDLYVQFTSKDNAMDRTAVQEPDHSDPVGTYGYPIAYVLKYPADVWYGKGARYLRVLQSTSKRTLHVNYIDNISKAQNILVKMGFDIRSVYQMLDLAKSEYKERIKGPNPIAKQFFQAAQIDLLGGPTGKNSDGTNAYRIRTGQEQTALFLNAGFDAILDSSTNNKQAVINPREPEQIIFLTRAAFRVLEVVPLRPLGHVRQNPDQSKQSNKMHNLDQQLPTMTHSDPSAERIERPFVAMLAKMLGDELKEGPERQNMAGWSFYWTRDGRRIEVKFEKPPSYYDDKKIGEKKHREDKLFDSNKTAVTIRTEHGDLIGRYESEEKFKDIAHDLLVKWIGLKKQPVTDWKPESKASYHQKEKESRNAVIDAKIAKERQERIAQLPAFIKDVQWVANHYGLSFTPNENFEANEMLVDAAEWFKRGMNHAKGELLDDEFEFIKDSVLGGNREIVHPQWAQMEEILKVAWPDLWGSAKHEQQVWLTKFSWNVFNSMRRILTGWKPGQPDPGYDPVSTQKAA